MKKGLALVAVAVLLFAACGKEGASDVALTDPDSGATPTATVKTSTATTKPGASSAPAGATKTTAPAAAGTAATTAPAAAAKPAEGRANPPKDGTYVYSVSGTASDPFNPAAPPQKYTGEQTNTVTHSGDVYTTESTTSERAGRTTIRTKHTTANVTMLSLKSETAGGEFSCIFNPPLVITKFPIKPETFPTQQLKGEGNACDGTLDITVVKKESVKDATGRAWDTWQAKVKLTLKSDQLTLNQNDTRWVSPELGVEIKSVGTTDGKFGPTTFKGSANSALKKYPS